MPRPASSSNCVCAEGILECGSASYRLQLGMKGGSFAAALQGAARIFMLPGYPSAAGALTLEMAATALTPDTRHLTLDTYSYRRATMGLTLVARRAGR